jgi:hypothetical protein
MGGTGRLVSTFSSLTIGRASSRMRVTITKPACLRPLAVRPHRRDRRTCRWLGTILLVLGVGHVPLPRAEYHAISHQDGEGQDCVLHEHLLRWHPSASSGQTAARLHWHWVLPRPLDPRQPIESDDPGAARVLLAIDGALMVDKVVSPGLGVPPQRYERSHPGPMPLCLGHIDPIGPSEAWPSRRGPSAVAGALLARHVSLAVMLQRWTC